MSIGIMTQVWDLDLPDSEKIVLLALADNANDEGSCWPSVATLARKCSKDQRTIQRVILRLIDAGHLSKVTRSGTSNMWSVHPRHNATPGIMPPRQERPSPSGMMPPKPSMNRHNGSGSKDPSPSHPRKHRFPESWQPTLPYPEDVASMIAVWPPDRLERELANFRDYWLEQRTTRPGWDKTWHRRIRDQHDRVMRENRNGIATGKPLNLRGSRPDPALDMWRQAHAELAAEDPGEDPGIGFTAWPALPSHGSG